MDFFNKYKRKYIPQITDWEYEYPELKYKKDWWNLPNIEFLIFSPMAYKWILFLIVLLGALLFGWLSYYLFTIRMWVLLAISLFLTIRLGYASYLKLKSWKYANDINFYDIFLKE